MKLCLKAREHLTCPICQTQLLEIELGAWGCKNKHEFPLIDGVLALRPNLGLDPIIPQSRSSTLTIEERLPPKGILRLIKKVIGTDYAPYRIKPHEFIKADNLVLNLGSGVSSVNCSNIVNLDYYLFPSVNVIADAHNIPFEDCSFDFVISEYMIEHVKKPFRVCSEISRVLKPNGTLYISYPFIHPYHAFPDDYFRFTHLGLQAMFENMEVVNEETLTGPVCRWIGTTADIFTFWIKNKKLRFLLRALLLCFLSPIKLLDLALNKHAESKYHALTLLSVLRKKE